MEQEAYYKPQPQNDLEGPRDMELSSNTNGKLALSNGKSIRAKSALKAWLITLAIGGIFYAILWIIGSSFEYDDYGFSWYTTFWEPVPLLVGLFFLIIMALPLFTSAEKRGRILNAIIGWVFYLPIIRYSLLPSLMGIIAEMMMPFGAGGFFAQYIGISFGWSESISVWIDRGFLEFHSVVTATALVAVGLAITIVGFTQIIMAIRRKRLATHGLYATIRHPQHLGIALWTLGIAIGTARTVGFMAWFTIVYFYLLLAIREEKRLAEQFGAEYQSYQKTIPFMIPFISIDTRLHLPEKGWMRIGVLIVLYILGLFLLCSIMELAGVEFYRGM